MRGKPPMSTTPATDPTPILRRIVESRKRHVHDARRLIDTPELLSRIGYLDPPKGFAAAVSPGPAEVAVIAELKKGSPSRGIIRTVFPPVELARCLSENGAAALSVLTEPDFFFGDPTYLAQVRTAVNLPLLRKDFIVDEYQVYESRVLGADAILLIVKIVDRNVLTDLIGLARHLGMDSLVEVNTEDELETALAAGSGLIGINNRNLETLAVDRDTAARLGRLIPDGITTVAMSGIGCREDIDRYGRVGIRSFLIGEMLMRIPDTRDMGRALRDLTRRATGETS
jgi:indole-3-glycerol phosphate synthase